MTSPPKRLDYERPDDESAAGHVSPPSQMALGVGTFFLLVMIAGLIYKFAHAPILAVLNAMALGIGASLWARFRLQWHEFVPALAVTFAFALLAIPLVAFLMWVLS